MHADASAAPACSTMQLRGSCTQRKRTRAKLVSHPRRTLLGCVLVLSGSARGAGSLSAAADTEAAWELRWRPQASGSTLCAGVIVVRSGVAVPSRDSASCVGDPADVYY